VKRSACLVVLSVAALVGALLPGPSGAAPSIPPTVVHIADGDTIDVSTDHETRVRFLNVNTPENYETAQRMLNDEGAR